MAARLGYGMNGIRVNVLDLLEIETYGLPFSEAALTKKLGKIATSVPSREERKALARKLEAAFKTDNFGKLTRTQQAELRNEVRKLTEKHYKIASADTKRGVGGANVLTVDPSARSKGYVGAHDWDGAITMDTGAVDRARAASKELMLSEHAAVPQRIAEHEGNGVRTLLHETIHGASAIRANAYSGFGIGIEEATTEIAARKVARELFGFTQNVGVDTAFGLPQVSSVKEGAVFFRSMGFGAYDEFITPLFKSVAQYIPKEELATRIEEAALWTKQAVAKLPPYAHWSKDRHVGEFVRGLRLPEEDAKKLAKELMGKGSPLKKASSLLDGVGDIDSGDVAGAFRLFSKQWRATHGKIGTELGHVLRMLAGDNVKEYDRLVDAFLAKESR
jgi:hypothetical protein